MAGGLWGLSLGFRLHYRYRLSKCSFFRLSNDNYRARYRLWTFSAATVPIFFRVSILVLNPNGKHGTRMSINISYGASY